MQIEKLPRGIRNNNPGNLRHTTIPELPTKLVDGFAWFPDMLTGVQALFQLIYMSYEIAGHRTVSKFVESYAPATENDVRAYELRICQRTGINPLQMATYDIRLDKAWCAMDFARAIISVECGVPPGDWLEAPEWIAPSMMVLAMQRSAKWLYI